MSRAVIVWDNKGKTCDRYTVAIYDGYGAWDIYAMSANPKSPQGVNMYCDTYGNVDAMDECGERVSTDQLPEEVLEAIHSRKVA